jgi:hypothetical protein
MRRKDNIFVLVENLTVYLILLHIYLVENLLRNIQVNVRRRILLMCLVSKRVFS